MILPLPGAAARRGVINNTELLREEDRVPHGKYAIPRVQEPYEPKFEGTPKAWPPETLYTRSATRNAAYISDYRAFEPTHTFGKKQLATTLKHSLAAHGQPPTHALPSASLCSKTAPIVSTSIHPDNLAHTISFHNHQSNTAMNTLSALQGIYIEGNIPFRYSPSSYRFLFFQFIPLLIHLYSINLECIRSFTISLATFIHPT